MRTFDTGATRDSDEGKLSELDIAWAAGLFEGEGSIGLHGAGRKRKDGTRRLVTRLTMNQTDEDILNRFCRIVNAGTVMGPRLRPGVKPQWSWECSCAASRRVILKMYPWLGIRRQAKALEVFGENFFNGSD